jgi:23S rRNA pseudouridine1911/1915/1917 synthase
MPSAVGSDKPGDAFDLTVADDEDGMRLDRLLASHLPALSRSRLQALIRTGAVSGAGATICEPGQRVKRGQALRLVVPPPEPANPEAEAIPLTVVYEDADLVVIDKPAGLVVHPAPGNKGGTLVNALLAHCGDSLSGIGGVKRPGIVHRLDKDTSGLLVVAKSDAAHQGLAEQFSSHGADGRLHRVYRALVWGAPVREKGTIEAPLARSSSNRTKIAVAKSGGRRAVTHYEVIKTYRGATGKPVASLVELVLETGRTHQIRVHLAHAGHPVMADPVYGAGFKASARALPPAALAAYEALGRQALHAAELGFEHPVTRASMTFKSALPSDMARLVGALARRTPKTS